MIAKYTYREMSTAKDILQRSHKRTDYIKTSD